MRLGTRIEHLVKSAYFAPRILARYGTLRPGKVQLTGCENWIHINPADGRAQKKFIRDPLRHRISTPLRFWRAFNSHLRPTLALDVGANYGECLFGTNYDKTTFVFGVEANPLIVPCLEQSRAEHPARDRITLAACLASAKAAENIPFFADSAWSGNSTATSTLKDVPGVRQFLLKARTLDSILPADLARGAVMLFKMDIEGFEAQAFRGFDATLSLVTLAVGLVEFDSKFTAASGESPTDYFARLAERFDIYQLASAHEQQLTRMRTYQELPPSRSADRRIHTDLVLVTRGKPTSEWLAPGWKIA